jgi:hypothetical protein
MARSGGPVDGQAGLSSCADSDWPRVWGTQRQGGAAALVRTHLRTATRTVLGGRPASLFLSFCHLRAFARRRPLPLFKLSTHRNGGVRGTTPLEVGTAVAQLSKLRYKFTNCAILPR